MQRQHEAILPAKSSSSPAPAEGIGKQNALDFAKHGREMTEMGIKLD